MEIVFFEDRVCSRFLPLTYTKPLSHLRMGIYTMSGRWSETGFDLRGDITRDYLKSQFPEYEHTHPVFINSRLFPTPEICERIRQLADGESLWQDKNLLATRSREVALQQVPMQERVSEVTGAILLEALTDIFSRNGYVLKQDFEWAIKNKAGITIDPSNTIIGDKNLIFISEGARVLASTLNTLDGPIFLDKDAEIMEGSHIRGPFYLGEHSQIKMGAKIYGPTTIGQHCKVGGEVSNSVIMGYSNKAHDGFLGNSVIGEWCNLGADTNTSNLKNNYSHVKTWQYDIEAMADTGLTFCGLVMGDHSKCGINTMLNTGTVIGVGSNIFGGDFPPKHVPSFSWGGSGGFEEYDLQKMLSTASQVYARRGLDLTDKHREILQEVFQMTAKHRQDATQSQE